MLAPISDDQDGISTERPNLASAASASELRQRDIDAVELGLVGRGQIGEGDLGAVGRGAGVVREWLPDAAAGIEAVLRRVDATAYDGGELEHELARPILDAGRLDDEDGRGIGRVQARFVFEKVVLAGAISIDEHLGLHAIGAVEVLGQPRLEQRRLLRG